MDNGACSYRRFLEGDQKGMEELIRDYKDRLIFYLYGFTHDLDDAEELMEETFVMLVVKKPRFKEDALFKTWLYTVARRKALDWLRKERKKAGDIPEELADSEELEEGYLQREEYRSLWKAMKSLNKDYRQVLILSYFEGMDNSRIASVMKKSKRQVENCLYRAKQSLKKALDKEDA